MRSANGEIGLRVVCRALRVRFPLQNRIRIQSRGRNHHIPQTAEALSMSDTIEPRWQVVDFAELPGTPCPCGTAKRAFAEVDDYPATIHVTEIKADAELHYHKRLTETYFILECGPDAKMQLDEEIIPLRQGMCIRIPPGVRHRAIGTMKIINIVIPKFDPADEHFD